jgi:hypothetical protein
MALTLVAGLWLAGCAGSKTARVTVKFDIAGGDNSFGATVYAQEVTTGQTLLFTYEPHTPYISVELPAPGRYVFYARLVEAPDDYHYGYTSESPTAYGHGTRGGTQDPAKASLIAVEVKARGQYKAYINDYRAVLPARGAPVTVPWRAG